MSLKQQISHRSSGPIMILIGANILVFVFSGQYWILLNPKYAMVTAAAGFVCCLLGALLVVRPATLQRQTLFSALLILCLLCSLNIYLLLRPQGSSSGFSASVSERMDRKVSRETRFDKEYIRINIAELATLVEIGSPLIETQNFLFRGQIYQSGAGESVVVRTAVACCLADAISIGIRVGTDAPPAVEDGQWVKVYGRVVKVSDENSTSRQLKKATRLMTVVQPGVQIRADAVEETPPPDFSPIFQFQQQEPFAY